MHERRRFNTRRGFIRETGALVTAGLLLNSSQVHAQSQASGGHRVYRSGDTIDDVVAQFRVDGWNVEYPYESPHEYLSKSDRRVEIILRGNLVTGRDFAGNQFQKDDKAHVRLQALPTEAEDRAYLHIFEKETRDRDYSMGRVLAERVYPIALDFHTFGDFLERSDGLGIPTAREIGVLSEMPLDQAVLGKIFEVYRAFGSLGWGSPPIYVHRFEDIMHKNPRDAHLWDRAIQVHAEAVAHPRDYNGLEGISRVFMKIAQHVGSEKPFYGLPDPALRAKIRQIHAEFLQSIGFKEEEYTGLNSKLEGQAWVDNRAKLADKPQSKALDLDSYLLDEWHFPDYSVSYSRDIYRSVEALFGSALAVFRFFPEQFLDRFNKMKPDEQREVSQIGKTVLDYLASYARAGELRGQLDLVRAVPAYHVLQTEFMKRAA